jgi:hypothetical protein
LTLDDIEDVLFRTHPTDSAEGLHAVNQLVDKGFFSAPPSLKILLPSRPLDLLHFYPTYRQGRQSWWKGWLLDTGEKATSAMRQELFEKGVFTAVVSLLKACI